MIFSTPCRSCSGANVEIVLGLGSQPHCNRLVRSDEPDPPHYPLRLGFCHDCTLVQIDHTIPKEEMFRDYPYVSGTTATLVEHFRASTERLAKQYSVGSGDLVVDIGSNDGTWLKQWRGKATVMGVEPDKGMAGLAFAQSVPTMVAFFDEDSATDLRATYGPAKLITAAGVFFHLEDLHSVVRGCEMLLADDGVLIVQAIYLGDMIRNAAFDQVYHEHLCYYTLRSISALVEQHGMEVVDCKWLPIHGGSMEYHIARKGGRIRDPRVEWFGTDELARGLGKVATYRKFANYVHYRGGDLKRVLQEYRALRKRVWAYGAPAKGATMLNSFSIGSDLVQCAVEKNPRKVGLEIPGCRIPIVAEGTPQASADGYNVTEVDRPDAYLVLAWNFLDEFIAKERDWLKAGGEFIVPVPNVRVITGKDV